jgi:menaquinone-specific isochorismate synthase
MDPGTGPNRYRRALKVAKDSGSVVFASFTFDEDQAGSVVILPEISVRVDAGARFSLRGEESSLPTASDTAPLPHGSRTMPDRTVWYDAFAAAMKTIRQGEVEKVVLSRTVDLEFAERIQAHAVIENLVTAQPMSHTYAIEGLVGSSPELLIQLQAGSIRSVSLAGSADRTVPDSISSLSTPKASTEHALAADSVEDALAPHCIALIRHESDVATFGNIHHLATSFAGTAKPGTAVTDVLATLHPTAAVAGTPTGPAMELIREIEQHDRGRYAGPIGWIDGTGDGEFAIALRCGLISNQSVRLFAGAGLVEGSEADAEFDETEIKLEPMLEALGLG